MRSVGLGWLVGKCLLHLEVGGGGVVEKSQSFDVLGVCHAAKQITEE